MAKWKWCLEENNVLLTGWQKVGDYWYYLNANGSMQTGWYQDANKKWYYFKDNGQMATGWIQLNDKWYYLYETTDANKAEYIGTTAYSCTKTINNKSYKFDEDGVMQDTSTSLVSDACIDFIKSWEGYYGTPYYDEVGVLTLGYGMTGDEIQGLTSITEVEATTMLKDWIDRKYAPVVKADLDSKSVTLTQNEFDALVSFAYNCGTGGLLGSTLYKNVVASVKDSDTIISNFIAWSNGGGKRIEGLYRRRSKEAAMFLNADYTGNN